MLSCRTVSLLSFISRFRRFVFAEPPPKMLAIESPIPVNISTAPLITPKTLPLCADDVILLIPSLAFERPSINPSILCPNNVSPLLASTPNNSFIWSRNSASPFRLTATTCATCNASLFASFAVRLYLSAFFWAASSCCLSI